MDRFSRRKMLIGIALFYGLIAVPSFLEHYLFFLTGEFGRIVVQNRWDIVLLNIGGFLLFLLPLHYRRKADWKSMGIYSAFIVSLFVEMYGVPLTVYLTAGIANGGSRAVNYLFEFSLLGQSFGLTAWMLFGVIITAIGMLLVAVGWHRIYRSEEELVTSGVYRFSRHPQYLGIMLIAAGWFIGWPSILTTMILPFLIYSYYRLCQREEKEVIEELGEEKYRKYRADTPFLL